MTVSLSYPNDSVTNGFGPTIPGDLEEFFDIITKVK